MAFWDKWFGNVSEQPSESIDRPTFLIYILLPEPLQPLERGSRYEDPLEAELQLAGVGFVSGGGSSLGPEGADGSAEIEFCGVDVDAYDVDAALKLLRIHLLELGCVKGTQLQYRDELDVPLLDEYDGGGWKLGLPRTFMHPGFGI